MVTNIFHSLDLTGAKAPTLHITVIYQSTKGGIYFYKNKVYKNIQPHFVTKAMNILYNGIVTTQPLC